MTRFVSLFQQYKHLFGIALVLSSGFLLFPFWLVFLEVVLGVGIWSFIRTHSTPSKVDFSSPWFFWGIFSVLVGSRFFIFFLSETPLGYDTGIYRYELWASFQALPEYVSQLFLGLPLVTNVLQLFGVPLDTVLGWFYGGLALFLPLSMVLVADRMWGRKVGFFVLFLFLVSLIQWKAYTMVLFKQELSLALSFFAIFLLWKRSWLVLLVLPFIALLQPLDAFLLGVSCLIFGLVSSFSSVEQRKYFLGLLLAGSAFGGVLLLMDPSFWRSAWEIFSQGIFYPEVLENSLQTGVFLSLSDYGYQSAFFFVFGVLGIALDWKHRKSLSFLGVYFLVLFLWIAFGLFFYQRILIHLDAVLILFSGYALFHFTQSFAIDRWGKVLLSGVFIALMIPLAFTLDRFQPLILSPEREKIQQFCEQLPNGAYVAATDSFYGPWLRGYCLEQRVFAPGLFPENRWSRQEWQAFWSGEAEIIPELLGRYESEVYFYRGEQQFQLEFDEELFEWVEGGWWRGGVKM